MKSIKVKSQGKTYRGDTDKKDNNDHDDPEMHLRSKDSSHLDVTDCDADFMCPTGLNLLIESR